MPAFESWRDDLKAGDVVAIRYATAMFSPPYRLHRVERTTRMSVALEGIVGLVRRADSTMVEATPGVRLVIEKHALREWARYEVEQQLLKLNVAQQRALRSLVSRMAADPSILS